MKRGPHQQSSLYWSGSARCVVPRLNSECTTQEHLSTNEFVITNSIVNIPNKGDEVNSQVKKQIL